MSTTPFWIYLVIAFFVFTVVLVVVVLIKNARRKTFSLREMEYIRSHWIRIIDTFGGNTVSAILDADKLLDYALGKKGYMIGSIGEKLKKAGPRFSDLNGVWRAHKFRNRLAHELTEVNKEEAKDALKQFKRALNDLGANL